MRRTLLIAMALLLFAAPLQAAPETKLRLPDNSTGKGKLITSTDTAGEIAMDVYVQGGMLGAATSSIALSNTEIAVPITVAAGAKQTYTLPGGANTGTYELNVDAPFKTFYAEDKDADAGARMLMRANEHAFVCEGSLCTLPTTIRFYNPDTTRAATYYIVIRYQ